MDSYEQKHYIYICIYIYCLICMYVVVHVPVNEVPSTKVQQWRFDMKQEDGHKIT